MTTAPRPASSPDPDVRYPVVLFDLDHTLFDFEASKVAAFEAVCATAGLTDRVDELRSTLTRVERPLWRALENGEVSIHDLNRLRFERLVADSGVAADPQRMAGDYLSGLGTHGGLLPGARELLDALHPLCTLALITNGYREVQRPRLDGFDLARYFDAVVISGEIGVSKPDPAFFDAAMSQLGHPPSSSVLVVGDSLTSDMAGALAYGLDRCWYNPAGPEVDADPEIDLTHVVHDLASVAPIVLGNP